jgi:hypothetical protein
VACRFDKLAVRFETTVLVAAINEWLWPTNGRRPVQPDLVLTFVMPRKPRGWPQG